MADQQGTPAAERNLGVDPALDEALRRIDELERLAKNERELALRYAADLENFKKRSLKERDDFKKYALEKLAVDLLLVYDNLSRALDQSQTASDLASLGQGVELTRRMFEDTLSRHGIRAFSAVGEVFDPNRHEAISATETSEVPPNQVLSEMLKGFTLNDRVVRPALVVVAKAPAND